MLQAHTGRTIALLLAVAALLLANPVLGAPSEADQAIGRSVARQGFAAYKAGDYEKALSTFEKARQLYPTGQVLRMTGYTLVALQRWSQAADALEAALAADFKPLDEGLRKEVRSHLGRALFKAGQHQRALQVLQQVRQEHPSGPVLRMTGRCLLALQRWLEAADTLEAALAAELEPLDAPSQAIVKQLLAVALGHLATVDLSSAAQGATVRIDEGEPRELPLRVRLLEGQHVLTAGARGYHDRTMRLAVVGGQDQQVTLPLEPLQQPKPDKPPAPPPAEPWFPHQKTIGLITTGTGLVFGGIALGLYLDSASLRSSVEDNIAAHNATYGADCSRGDYAVCYYDAQVINRDADRVEAKESASLGFGIAAGVLLATGATFFFFDPSVFGGDGEGESSPDTAAEDSSPGVSWMCGPYAQAGLGCVGSF